MNDTTRCLARSASFEIHHEYETVWLTRQGVRLAVVGDFYGDPEVAIIDSDEQWCAVGGCGLIVYFLEAPFHEYKYGTSSAQYFEIGRRGEDMWWITSIHQTGGSEIEVILEDGVTHTIEFLRTGKSCAIVVH